MAGYIAKKLEMTRVLKEDSFIPVTLLQVPKLQVIGKRTQEKDGYSALIVGVNESEEVALQEGKTTLPVQKFSTIKEFRVEESALTAYEIGSVMTLDALEGDISVSIEGVSKGHGFSGAMKRHNFSGGPKTHGSKFHRALGSIGNRKPTRTHKGKKMHGHYGCDTVSLRSVPVEFVNKEAGIVAVRGPIPGGRNSLVYITL